MHTEPQTIGSGYEVQKVLGSGAFGTVFLAKDSALNRKVAIKIPNENVLRDEKLRQRFLREARAVAGLEHNNIVRVHTVSDQVGDRYSTYIVYEYVKGISLRDYIKKKGRVSPYKAAMITKKIADALSYAHEKGVLHRDIKSHNIILTREGEPKLLDFGLAKINEEDDDDYQSLTNTNDYIGTPAYMAPEQLSDSAKYSSSSLSDQYSLGIVLYEMLTGEIPFRGKSIIEIFKKIADEELVSPREVCADVPEELASACMKATSKKPSDRFSNCGDFSQNLKSIVAQRNSPKPIKTKRTTQNDGPTETLEVTADTTFDLPKDPKPQKESGQIKSGTRGWIYWFLKWFFIVWKYYIILFMMISTIFFIVVLIQYFN